MNSKIALEIAINKTFKQRFHLYSNMNDQEEEGKIKREQSLVEVFYLKDDRQLPYGDSGEKPGQ